MKKVVYKVVASVLAIAMISAATSCSRSAGSSSSTTSASSGSGSSNAATVTPFTVNWYVNLPSWKWSGEGWGKDLTSQIVQQKTGANIQFTVATSDDNQQLTTMIASGNLPDVITMDAWWDSNTRMLCSQMSSQGYLISFNDLIDKYDANLGKVARKDVLNWYAESDGKTYVYPNYAYSSQDVGTNEHLVPNRCITVNKEMYEKIGSPDMSTPEKFLAACQKAKDEVKTYNGQSVVPIQLYESGNEAVSIIEQYFAVPYEDESGNFLYDFNQPKFKEGLQFLNSAYQKGLISAANFSETRDNVNESVASGRVFCMITAPQDFTTQLQTLYAKDSKAVYVPVLLRNQEGDDPVLSDIRGWGWLVNCVSKKAKNPDKIAKLFEYLISDQGQIDMTYGKEGVTYAYTSNKKIKMTDDYTQALANNNAKKYGVGAFNLLLNYAFTRHYDTTPTDPMLLATTDTYIKAPMSKYSYDESAEGLKLDPKDSQYTAMKKLQTSVDQYRTQEIAKLITAKNDNAFNAEYDAAWKTLQSMGVENLIKYDNTGFQTAKKALGISRSWPTLK